MIEDFARQLLLALEERRQDYVELLVVSSTDQDRNRGAIRGIDDCIDNVKAQLKLYNIDEQRAAA